MLKAAISQTILRLMPLRAADYTNDLLTRYRVERAALTERQPPHDLLLRSVRETGAKHVVDFGGGAGDMARDLVAAVSSVRVTVVENESMAAMGRPSPGVTFASTLPAECDVFFTSGALFYVSNPMTRLEQGFQASRRVIMVRNYFGPPLVVTQRSWLHENGNGPRPSGFPRWAAVSYRRSNLDEGGVLALAERYGFKLIDHKPGLHGRDLVFKREP